MSPAAMPSISPTFHTNQTATPSTTTSSTSHIPVYQFKHNQNDGNHSRTESPITHFENDEKIVKSLRNHQHPVEFIPKFIQTNKIHYESQIIAANGEQYHQKHLIVQQPDEYDPQIRSTSPLAQPFPEYMINGSNNHIQQLALQQHAKSTMIAEQPPPLQPSDAPYDVEDEIDARVERLNQIYKTSLQLQGHCSYDSYGESLPTNYPPNKYETFQRNNSLSPYLKRKLSLQTHQRIQNDGRINSNLHCYRTSISATASPNLDARRRFHTSIPDSHEPNMARLHGNTSPIGKLFLSL